MKRMTTLLLALTLALGCLSPALAEGFVSQAADMPAGILAYFSARSFDGYTVGPSGFLSVRNTAGGSFCFAVTQKGSHNVLHLFKEKNGKYEHVLRTDKALPQGEGFFSLTHCAGSVLLQSDRQLSLGHAVSILFTRADNEEQGYAAELFEVNAQGQWNLRLLNCSSLWREAVIGSDRVTYYYEGEKEGSVRGVVQTDLRYFSFDAFPKTVEEAKTKLSLPPDVPYSAELQATQVKFSGGKRYPVYTGPGEKFLRAANGKAAVSTNDWIQVFGVEDGWAMIQYDLSSDRMRIGWIEASALPKNANVNALRLNDQPAVTVAEASMTDDPLKSQTALRVLPKGYQVTWLATLGSWAYVQDDQDWARGFVPLSAISQNTEKVFSSQPVTGFGYRASAAAVLRGGEAEISAEVADTRLARIKYYQVYANNMLIGAAEADPDSSPDASVLVYRSAVALPAGISVIGLCPVYADGVKAEEAITIFVEQ